MKNNTHIDVTQTSNNRVIAAHDLYCCLLPQCEALHTYRSGFLIATTQCLFAYHTYHVTTSSNNFWPSQAQSINSCYAKSRWFSSHHGWFGFANRNAIFDAMRSVYMFSQSFFRSTFDILCWKVSKI